MREIDRASGRGARLGVVLGLWWATWLLGVLGGVAMVVGVVVDLVDALNRSPDPARLLVPLSDRTLVLGALTESALAMAAILAVVVARSITRRQRIGAPLLGGTPPRPDIG
jgi:hypothetical protein